MSSNSHSLWNLDAPCHAPLETLCRKHCNIFLCIMIHTWGFRRKSLFPTDPPHRWAFHSPIPSPSCQVLDREKYDVLIRWQTSMCVKFLQKSSNDILKLNIPYLKKTTLYKAVFNSTFLKYNSCSITIHVAMFRGAPFDRIAVTVT